jgi:hypothetical protein
MKVKTSCLAGAGGGAERGNTVRVAAGRAGRLVTLGILGRRLRRTGGET